MKQREKKTCESNELGFSCSHYACTRIKSALEWQFNWHIHKPCTHTYIILYANRDKRQTPCKTKYDTALTRCCIELMPLLLCVFGNPISKCIPSWCSMFLYFDRKCSQRNHKQITKLLLCLISKTCVYWCCYIVCYSGLFANRYMYNISCFLVNKFLV